MFVYSTSVLHHFSLAFLFPLPWFSIAFLSCHISIPSSLFSFFHSSSSISLPSFHFPLLYLPLLFFFPIASLLSVRIYLHLLIVVCDTCCGYQYKCSNGLFLSLSYPVLSILFSSFITIPIPFSQSSLSLPFISSPPLPLHLYLALLLISLSSFLSSLPNPLPLILSPPFLFHPYTLSFNPLFFSPLSSSPPSPSFTPLLPPSL